MSFPSRAGRIPPPAKKPDDERDEEDMAIPTLGTVPVGGTVSARRRGGRRPIVAVQGHRAQVRPR
jgi:hypothetical protein